VSLDSPTRGKDLKNVSEDPRFLSDAAIETDAQDEFRIHSAYADALARIAGAAPTPFVVGLLGGWGSGKTSIIRLLQRRLASSQDDSTPAARFVYFDVWKFAREPLNRWILFELERQLAESGLHKFEQFKYKGRTLQSYLEFEEEWEQTLTQKDEKALNALKWTFRGLLALFLGTLLLITWAPSWPVPLDLRISLHAIIRALNLLGLTGAAGIGLIGVLYRVLHRLVFKQTTRHIAARPVFSAEKFDELFRAMVTEAVSDGRRLVVCFDNLDRAPAETAVETLAAVKTFLDVKGCVYVIPCDDQALVQHLSRNYGAPVLGEDAFAPKEFLRKFFQVTLRLPRFLQFDLEEYVDKVVSEARLTLPSEAKDVIVLAYGAQNPRQVKRFINDFLGYLHLAETAESSGLLRKGEFTDNPALLAKMVALSSEWPRFLERVAADPDLWADIAAKLARNEVIEEIDDGRLLVFLRATRSIEGPEDPTAFIYLKRAIFDPEGAMRGEVRVTLRSGDHDRLTRMLESQGKAAARLATEVVRAWVGANRRLSMENALRALLLSAARTEPATRRELLSAIGLLIETLITPPLASPDLVAAQFSEVLSPVVEILGELPSWRRTVFAEWVVKVFQAYGDGKPVPADTLVALSRARAQLSQIQHQDIGRAIAKPLATPEKEPQALELLEALGNLGALKELNAPPLANAVASKITFTPDATNRRCVALFPSVGQLASHELLSQLADRAQNTLARGSSTDEASELAFKVVRAMAMDTLLSPEHAAKLWDLIQGYLSSLSPSQYSPWVSILLSLRDLVGHEKWGNVVRLLAEKLATQPPAEIFALLERLGRTETEQILAESAVKAAIKKLPTTWRAAQGAGAEPFAEQLFQRVPAELLIRGLGEVVDAQAPWTVPFAWRRIHQAYTQKEIDLRQALEGIDGFLKTVLAPSLPQQAPLLIEVAEGVGNDASLAANSLLMEQVLILSIDTMRSDFEQGKKAFETTFPRTSPSGYVHWYEVILDQCVRGQVSQNPNALAFAVHRAVATDRELLNAPFVERLAEYSMELSKSDPARGVDLLKKLTPLLHEELQHRLGNEVVASMLAVESQAKDLSPFADYVDLLSTIQHALHPQTVERLSDLAERLTRDVKTPEDIRLGLRLLLTLPGIPLTNRVISRLGELRKDEGLEDLVDRILSARNRTLP